MLAALKKKLAQQRGADAESRAEAHLLKHGLKPVARNWRCPLGELDVVMRDGDTLVIVEVRARSSHTHGGALASIDGKKRSKLMRTTLAFVQAYPVWQDAPIRFDIVSFEADDEGRWLMDAFTTDDAA